jgi:hypothetical protein
LKTVSSVLEALPERPKGWVSMRTMIRYFWPHKDSQPSTMKIIRMCREGMPHLRFGVSYYFRLAEIEAFLGTRTVAPKQPASPHRSAN